MTRSILDTVSPKITRQLAAGEGYLELGLPAAALRELNKVTDAGALAASWHYLKGEALRELKQYDAAVRELEQSARLLPAPFKRFAWDSLSHCYEALGNETLARMAYMLAQGEVISWEAGDLDEELDNAIIEQLLEDIQLEDIEEEKDELI